LHVLLGGKPQSSALQNLLDLPSQVLNLHGHAVLLGVITLGILFAWPMMPKKLAVVPGALVAVVVATAISTFAWLDVVRVDLPSNLFNIPRPTLPSSDWLGFLGAAISIAIVASVESLLCAVATDKLHSGPRANLDKELMAQGAANAVAGLAGGLPVTGVIVRSTANIQAGAVSRASAILHGLWIVLFVLLLGRYVELIPLPALAGLLVYVGIKLVSPQHIRELSSHREEAVYVATLLGVTFVGLLQGVAIGLALSLLLLLARLSRCRVHTEEKHGRWHVLVEGTLTFATVPRISTALEKIPAGSKVDVDLSVDFMDHAAFDVLHTWRLAHEKLGGTVDIDELHEAWYQNASDGKPMVKKPENGPARAAGAFLRNSKVERMHDLARGVKHFKRVASQKLHPLFKKLAHEGQSPKVLFLTCGDSRVAPEVITAAEPGSLFTIRNIGNLVPRHTATGTRSDDSVGAALEFTLDVLKIENIVVCGHSECGAMKALLRDEQPGNNESALESWLTHAAPSVERYRSEQRATEELSACNCLSRTNVVQQLENLRSYPKVQARLEQGTLHLCGWYFDIEHAEVHVYDEVRGAWMKIDDPLALELYPYAQPVAADKSPAMPAPGLLQPA